MESAWSFVGSGIATYFSNLFTSNSIGGIFLPAYFSICCLASSDISSEISSGRGFLKYKVALSSLPYFTSLITAVHGVECVGRTFKPIIEFINVLFPFLNSPITSTLKSSFSTLFFKSNSAEPSIFNPISFSSSTTSATSISECTILPFFSFISS